MNTINTIFQEPTKENIKEFLTQWITTIPRHVKHEHGLCIAKLGEILKNHLIIILEKTEEYILIHWKPYTNVNMELRIMKDSIIIKDYTYIILPFYECSIKIF